MIEEQLKRFVEKRIMIHELAGGGIAIYDPQGGYDGDAKEYVLLGFQEGYLKARGPWHTKNTVFFKLDSVSKLEIAGQVTG